MKRLSCLLFALVFVGYASATDFGWLMQLAKIPRAGLDTKPIRIGPSILDAQELYIRQRMNDSGKVDWLAFEQAATARDAMQAFRGAEAAPAWTLMGPRDQDVPFRIWFGTNRSTSGRVTCMAWDPSYNSKIVYLGSAGGGVWRSTDSGKNWACITDVDSWPHLQVSALAIDPKKPRTIYAGTGGSRGFFRLYGFGIMKSTDAGATWTQLNTFNAGPLEEAVSDILVHPDDSDLVFVTTHGRNENGVPTAGLV